MKFIGKYWKLFVAIALLVGAAYLYFNTYQMEKLSYETQAAQLKMMNTSLEAKIQENMRYVDIQEDLAAATERVERSRLDLYEHFPVEMKEEDQIMYVLYLETIFGTEINFQFNQAGVIQQLRDGSNLMGLLLTVNYETNYKGFKDMVKYLATDSRVTSVYYTTIEYDAATDKVKGDVTLLLYLIDTTDRDYVSPTVAEPSTGKDNIYD